jgi:hypothetical protein
MTPDILNVVLGGILAALAMYYLARLLFRTDTAIENRRKAAGQMAIVLGRLGLKKIPAFLIDYSVGDYSGMANAIVELTKLFLSGEAAVLEEFAEVGDNVLTARLSTEEGRAYIAARLSEAAKEGDVGAVSDAPQATTK